MSTPVILPTLSWGAFHSPRRALLVHGLGSNGALMWRFGVELAALGWHATAVDLRGHGTAPRALDYTLAAYAADLVECRPDADAAPWDLVIGHSLGGAAAVLAAAAEPEWARRLVLIDPAIVLTSAQREDVRQGQLAQLADPSAEAVRAEHPTWHPQDVELKVQSTLQVSAWAIDQTMAQNPVWDVRSAVGTLPIPVHIIAGDPDVYALVEGELAESLTAHLSVTLSVVTGAGHSPHRDLPEATMVQLRAALA